jgi:hypothetical protein
MDYTEPYGFAICDDAAPKIALAFLDDQSFYFVELDVNRPITKLEPLTNEEVINLSTLVSKVSGTANWEPKFKIQRLAWDAKGWRAEIELEFECLVILPKEQPDAPFAELRVQRHQFVLQRSAPKVWIESTTQSSSK